MKDIEVAEVKGILMSVIVARTPLQTATAQVFIVFYLLRQHVPKGSKGILNTQSTLTISSSHAKQLAGRIKLGLI